MDLRHLARANPANWTQEPIRRDKPPVEDADVFFHSIPNSLLKGLHVAVTEAQNKHDEVTLKAPRKSRLQTRQRP
jgi:hypothetical protein